MAAVLRILDAAGAHLRYDTIEVGQRVYLAGNTAGITPESWEILRRNGVLLKAPITTPLGGGYKSLNVTIRKALGLFANVRPAKAYMPFVGSQHPSMNVVVIRENEEDLYAGIEHQQTREVTQVLKLVSRPGSEKVIRYAFEYARAYGRRKITCMTKDNIMKQADGLFHKIFEQVGAEYPEIAQEHQIIDIGAARLATRPDRYDVIVTLNLYGDIISDIAADVAGSVGLAGSANIGERFAMFEAVHGSAPDIAGRDVANPSGLLIAATQMLVHVGQAAVAERIKNAWLRTLEDGLHTLDIFGTGLSKRCVGTQAFADAVIERLGATPVTLAPVQYQPGGIHVSVGATPPAEKRLDGVDVFVDWSDANRDPAVLGGRLEAAASNEDLQLVMISNRGVKVYPGGFPETFCTDHWRCRFVPVDGAMTFSRILRLLAAVDASGLEVIKTEHLYSFDGIPGYSLGQGQ